jgi:hypothetical protein
VVSQRVNFTVDDTIIGEEPDAGLYIFLDVVDIKEEKGWAQHRPLWHARSHWCP